METGFQQAGESGRRWERYEMGWGERPDFEKWERRGEDCLHSLGEIRDGMGRKIRL